MDDYRDEQRIALILKHCNTIDVPILKDFAERIIKEENINTKTKTIRIKKGANN